MNNKIAVNIADGNACLYICTFVVTDDYLIHTNNYLSQMKEKKMYAQMCVRDTLAKFFISCVGNVCQPLLGLSKSLYAQLRKNDKQISSILDLYFQINDKRVVQANNSYKITIINSKAKTLELMVGTIEFGNNVDILNNSVGPQNHINTIVSFNLSRRSHIIHMNSFREHLTARDPLKLRPNYCF